MQTECSMKPFESLYGIDTSEEIISSICEMAFDNTLFLEYDSDIKIVIEDIDSITVEDQIVTGFVTVKGNAWEFSIESGTTRGTYIHHFSEATDKSKADDAELVNWFTEQASSAKTKQQKSLKIILAPNRLRKADDASLKNFYLVKKSDWFKELQSRLVKVLSTNFSDATLSVCEDEAQRYNLTIELRK